jgi:hypothetical protein
MPNRSYVGVYVAPSDHRASGQYMDAVLRTYASESGYPAERPFAVQALGLGGLPAEGCVLEDVEASRVEVWTDLADPDGEAEAIAQVLGQFGFYVTQRTLRDHAPAWIAFVRLVGLTDEEEYRP